MKRGIFVGRFQPFHLGHLQDIKNALKEVDELAIGIACSQEHHTKENPFTVTERIEMISLTLQHEKIGNCVFFSVPDCYDDKKWVEHIENVTAPFQITFTGKNEWTERSFQSKGYHSKRLPFLEGVSGTMIRDKIRRKEEWKDKVPEQVSSYLDYIKAQERISELT